MQWCIRGINAAKTAYLSVSFTADFFDVFHLAGTDCSCSALVKVSQCKSRPVKTAQATPRRKITYTVEQSQSFTIDANHRPLLPLIACFKEGRREGLLHLFPASTLHFISPSPPSPLRLPFPIPPSLPFPPILPRLYVTLFLSTPFRPLLLPSLPLPPCPC